MVIILLRVDILSAIYWFLSCNFLIYLNGKHFIVTTSFMVHLKKIIKTYFTRKLYPWMFSYLKCETWRNQCYLQFIKAKCLKNHHELLACTCYSICLGRGTRGETKTERGALEQEINFQICGMRLSKPKPLW